MTIEIYKATLKHDNENLNLFVVSLSGEQGAKEQVMTAEKCPESAIVKIKKTSK
nr:hypothetical protein [Pedobacter sp. ASV2]